MKNRQHQHTRATADKPKNPPRKLTVEELEKRIAPSVGDKKLPVPPPYAPGTDYGLMRRDNLRW